MRVSEIFYLTSSVKSIIFFFVFIAISFPTSADWWSDQRDKVTGFVRDPVNTTREEAGRWGDQARDLVHLGGQGCRAKANDVMGRFRSTRGLTSLEKKYLTPFFGKNIDLNRVSVYWGADLNGEMKVGGMSIWVASDAQTFGYRIFFRDRRDPGNTRQLIDLAHELVHTVQYEKLGGLTEFCQQYMNGYFNAGSYEDNPMEQDAYENEFRFAKTLQNVPSTTGQTKLVHNNATNNYRSNQSVWVPERVR